MRIELTKQECIWLADLAKKAKEQAGMANKETPCRLFQLRMDNMSDLENKLNAAVQKEIKKERWMQDE